MSMTENDDIALILNGILDREFALRQSWWAWAGGTINGGPNGDGRYPLLIGDNVTVLSECPARMSFNARRVPRIRIAGSNSVTLDPALHQGAMLQIVGGTASSTVTVHIPQSIPAEFSCMVAAGGSGRLVFDIDGEGFLRHDQGYDRTRGTNSGATIYCMSRDSANRPDVYLFGSLAAA